MKYLYALLALMCFTLFAEAQTFGLSISGAVPTGDYGDVVNVGYNGGVLLEAPIFDVDAIVYGGYGFWNEKDDDFSFTNFPIVLAGARKYYGSLYGSILAGIYPIKFTLETEGERFETTETQGAILGGFGYIFPLSFLHLDVSGNYLWTQDYSQVVVGVGFWFNK